MSSSIVTFSGKIIDPINPDPEDICIEDIAHALSNNCRFTGHPRDFYSVAQHSVHVAWLLQDYAFDKETQLVGLMHDASEAYLSDLARPIKKFSHLGDHYEIIEGNLEHAIAIKFDLPYPPWPGDIKWADDQLLVAEARDLCHRKQRELLDVGSETCYTDYIRPWVPHKAEFMFLARYRDLTKSERPLKALGEG